VKSSVNLDDSYRKEHATANRWDYLLVRTRPKTSDAVEIHQGRESEIQVLIAKKAWAEVIIRRDCAAAGAITWHWILPPGSPCRMSQSSPASRRLALAGISFPRRVLRLA
jgi:hypothetical protein